MKGELAGDRARERAFTCDSVHFSKANKKYVSFNLYKRLIQNIHKKATARSEKTLKKKYERANMNNSHKWHWRVDIIVVCLSKHFSLHTKGYSTKHAHSTAKSNGKVIKCDLWCFGVVCISTSSTVRGLLCGYTILMRESKTGWCNVFRMLSAVHHRNGCCDNSNKSYPILANTYLFFNLSSIMDFIFTFVSVVFGSVCFFPDCFLSGILPAHFSSKTQCHSYWMNRHFRVFKRRTDRRNEVRVSRGWAFVCVLIFKYRRVSEHKRIKHILNGITQ